VAATADIAHRIPAGWYPDRADRSRRRWWDGTQWTDYYSANPEQDHAARAPHTLRRAITFKDRLIACMLTGLVASNIVLVCLVARVI
jgi:hypothetical protein